jgi:restriction endonuclease S subunit
VKLLKDIATIRSGYPFRERPVRVETGGCRLVQMSDLDKRLGGISPNLESVAAPSNWETHRLHQYDILFAARGQINGAGVLTSDVSNAIAASTLLVLRSNNQIVNPFYLAWHLNTDQTQAELKTMQAGSSIPFISIEDLGQLPVPVPSLEKQVKIVELESLGLEEQALMEMLRRRRQDLIKGAQKALLKNDFPLLKQ